LLIFYWIKVALKMTKYVIRRLLQSLIVIWGVTLLTFLTLHLAGDPTYLYVSERSSDEEVAEVRARLGFDKPLYEQYASFVWNMAQGDFGNSLKARRPALDVVLERLPATLELTIFAMVFSTVLGIPIGILAATQRGTIWDGGIMMFALLGQSIPNFWLGIMLIMYIGLNVPGIPISGHVPLLSPLLAGDVSTFFTNFPEAMRFMLMPGITVSLFSLARNARMTRSAMLEVLSADYVRTARAKGLSERAVVLYHAFRNALIPVVTILGLQFGFLLGGVVVVETVFSWPGVGRLVFNSINQRDIPVVQTSVFIFALTFIVLNLIVDLLYLRLDPRVRYE
jgi:peptide/nickel transport system permease protein